MKSITLTLLVLFVCISGHGQTINSGSTGLDGAFNPPSQMPANSTMTGGNGQGNCTQNAPCIVTIPLREPNDGEPVHSNGRHVFNFTTVTVGPNVTVKFARNVANTPVFILAQGNVVIDGVIDVSGESAGFTTLSAPQGGPGGFSGGTANLRTAPTFVGGAGSGPGGGSPTASSSFATGDSALLYGSAELQPLIGGSGGTGSGVFFASTGIGPAERINSLHGAGGGGAILIASSGTIALGSGNNVAVRAKGGDGVEADSGFGTPAQGKPGSGGAIRLIATFISGTRRLDATGGRNGPAFTNLPAGDGRIRLESTRSSGYAGITTPQASFVQSDSIFGQPIRIFPALTPVLRIVSIGGVPLPAQPTADASTPDISLPQNLPNPVQIILEATNVPSGTVVQVLASPQYGSGNRVLATGVLNGPVGQKKIATVAVDLPSTGVGNISAVIRTPIVPEPSSTGIH